MVSAPVGTPRSRPATDRVVAITGACTYLGTELLRRLEEDRRYAKILVLDVKAPTLLATGAATKARFFPIDLTQPTIDGEIATLLAREGVDTVVHGAFLSHPTHATEWAHEFEDVGTLHVMNACAAAAPARVVMVSTTMVYGAQPENPNFLDERAELRGHKDSRFINDKVRAEKQAYRFAREHPDTQVTTLRFAPILGPTVNNLHTRFYSRLMAPVMAGHDPLMQFIHEQDAAWALKLAVDSDATGPFNLVGKGVLPYTTVLAMLGRVPLPVPYLIARQAAKALWATQVLSSPPSLLDYLLYVCVADGARARRELGFTARFSIKRTLLDFVGASPEDGATDVASSYA
ncbi:MAG: NAD-dependent epimerase/dehydratase family protein [Kofleriaceae bacterium]